MLMLFYVWRSFQFYGPPMDKLNQLCFLQLEKQCFCKQTSLFGKSEDYAFIKGRYSKKGRYCWSFESFSEVVDWPF